MPNGSKMIGVIKTQQEKQDKKEFLARKKGLFFTQKPLETHNEFLICEGFATAMSVSKIMNKPSIAAIDSGNLLSVCDELIKKYPQNNITIFADNDLRLVAKGRDNIGLESAKKCQDKYPQIRIVYP